MTSGNSSYAATDIDTPEALTGPAAVAEGAQKRQRVDDEVDAVDDEVGADKVSLYSISS